MTSPDLIFQQALAALHSRNLAEAERLFLKVLQVQPNHVPTLNLLTVVLMNLNRFTDAETYIARAVHLDQSSDVSFYNYGLILQKLNKLATAVEQFSKAIELKPDVAETWNSRGVTLNALGRHEEAVADFSQALQLKPAFARMPLQQGQCFSRAWSWRGGLGGLRCSIGDPAEF